MLPAASKKGGQAFAFPDVCKTPAAPSPIPVPYPNMGMFNGTDKVIDKVLMENKETVVETRDPELQARRDGEPRRHGLGREPHRITFKKYSSKVYAKGKKIVHHTAMTQHNGSNANMPAGTHVAPSQTKVLVAL